MKTLTIALFVTLVPAIAEAKDCYVQRFSYTTSITCDNGDTYLRNEDNTRNHYGRRDLPSNRREPTTYYNGRRCSQTGSILSCN